MSRIRESAVVLVCVAWEYAILLALFACLVCNARPPRWYNGGP